MIRSVQLYRIFFAEDSLRRSTSAKGMGVYAPPSVSTEKHHGIRKNMLTGKLYVIQEGWRKPISSFWYVSTSPVWEAMASCNSFNRSRALFPLRTIVLPIQRISGDLRSPTCWDWRFSTDLYENSFISRIVSMPISIPIDFKVSLTCCGHLSLS